MYKDVSLTPMLLGFCVVIIIYFAIKKGREFKANREQRKAFDKRMGENPPGPIGPYGGFSFTAYPPGSKARKEAEQRYEEENMPVCYRRRSNRK